MKENIKSKNYIEMGLESESDSDRDSDNDNDNNIYVDIEE